MQRPLELLTLQPLGSVTRHRDDLIKGEKRVMALRFYKTGDYRYDSTRRRLWKDRYLDVAETELDRQSRILYRH